MTAQPPLPETARDLTADWMQQALAADSRPDASAIQYVAATEIGAGVGLVGTILRCQLTYRDANASGPATVIVKLPSSHPDTLQTARRLGLYRREYDYYRRLAPDVPLRSPALLYGDFDDDSHRFVMVLEDLGHLTAVDQLDGANAAQAKTAIRAVARMHGRYWNRVHEAPVSGFHSSAEPERHALVQAVYRASLAPALERFGHLFTAPTRRLAEDYGSVLAEHLAALAAGPQTFTHGDFRLDNMFFGRGDGDDFAAVDWQVSGIASGLYDVAYFLSSSVPVAVRREIEREALAEYHAIVAGMGADDFTLEECWRSYRRNLLRCFQTPIIAGGQLDFTSDRSRQLAEAFLTRTLTAIADLDAREFLPG